MNNHINIEIRNGKESLDLRIPNKLTLKSLKRLIAPILFREGIVDNDFYELKVANKSGFFVLPLKDYAIGDGDIFIISHLGEDDNERD
ncbi:EsaB/YukD family protein [Fructilactobacillus carniphilus]|uniref:EsaB/YukD family protein n=1 Tax=Fructilactobacillus carniphilus TaxID=2940297 RepID=A0ABY5BUV7_9LACO|nr:EsaB/YukD family protein [Fructilactobacillus carniphilus]USS90289.1 EsaB/YukD family protein [Fructilactobacillus carniphilus]